MGNQLSTNAPRVQVSDLVQTDVPELKYKDALGGGRFFKTHRCETSSVSAVEEGNEEEEKSNVENKKTKFNVGDVVVKVYVKRGQVPDLQKHEKRVRDIGKTLLKYPNSEDIVHVWPFQKALETERAVYLMRQYSFSTLYDRLNQRPFLSFVEKKWICYQLLHAMKFTHERNVTHGDVKCENVLMTSTNWVFLSDFASFKPKSVPADNPADFTFYFDAGGRRRCYLAPERFVDSNASSININNDSNSNLQELEKEKEKRMHNSARGDGVEDDEFSNEYTITREMDVFALGCVIGELFTDGTATFDLAQALAYRNKNEGYEPDLFIANNLLKSVPNDEKARDEILNLILAMINRAPYERPSAEEIFNSCVASGFFPEYFDALHAMGSDVINANSSSDVTIEYLKKEVPDLVKKIRKVEERLPSSKVKGGSPGMRILAQYVCLAIRACDVQSVRVVGFYLLEKYIGKYCDDQTRIDLIVPRCVETIKEKDSENDDDSDTVVVVNSICSAPSTSRVKAAAIRTLDATLSRAHDLQKSDSKLFQDYVWPALRQLAAQSSGATQGSENQSEYAKVVLAESLSRFCQNAFRFSAQRSALGCKEFIDEDQANLAEAFTKLTTANSGTIYSDDMGGAGSSAYNAFDDVDNNENNSINQNIIANGGDFDESANANISLGGKKTPLSESFDTSIQAHRNEARQIILDIFSSLNTHPNATLALLENIGEIAKFFGRKETTSFLLPLLVTCLNASDWRTKRAFLSNISDVAMECGASVTESFVVPCAERCLTDINDDVVHSALTCLHNIVSDDVEHDENMDSEAPITRALSLDLQTSVIVNACSKAAPLMCHPIQSIRDAAIDFFVSAAKKLGPVDCFALLAPTVEPFQRKAMAPSPPSSPSLLSSTEHNKSSDSLSVWVMCPDAFHDAQSVRAALRDPPLCESYERAVASLLQSDFVSADDLHNFANTVVLESLAIEESVQPLVPYILATLKARRRENARNASSPEGVATASGTLTVAPKHSSASAILSTFRKPLVVPDKSIPVVDVAQTSDSFDKPVASKSVNENAAAGRNISSSASWVPRGVLLAHLKEHRGAVNHLATAPTNSNVPFFVSCSDDGSCKIWDSRRLERDVSFRSRLTYASQSGKIKSACVLSENRVCSGSDCGSVHVWRVEYVKAMKTSKSTGEDWPDGRKRMYTGAAEKYTGAAEIHTYDISEGAVVSTLAISPSVVAFATQRGGCKVWDLRQSNQGVGRSAMVSLPWHPKRGVITSLANANGEVLTSDFSSVPFVNSVNINEEGFSTSPWFVLSTSTGEVELIDSRFMTSVTRWKAPTPTNARNSSSASTQQRRKLRTFSDSISCMSVRAFLPPSTDAIKMMKPLVWCSHKRNEIALWDVSTGECREVLRTLDSGLSGVELEAASRARPNVLASGTSLRKLDSDWRLSDPFLRSKSNDTESDIIAKTGSRGREENEKTSAEDDENVDDWSDEDDINDEDDEPIVDNESFRSLLSLPSGALISGGSDCTIRVWFPGDTSKSRILSGPPRHGSGRPRYVESRLESTSRLVRVGEAKQRPTFIRIQQETTPYQSSASSSGRHRRGFSGIANDNNHDTNAAARENSIASRNEGHHDAITALATVPSYSSSSSSAGDAFRGGRMLLSASRDGVIKAWK